MGAEPPKSNAKQDLNRCFIFSIAAPLGPFRLCAPDQACQACHCRSFKIEASPGCPVI